MAKWFKKNYALILIIILGFGLRLWGITYDLPLSSSVGDEVRLISGALKMLGEKNFIPESSAGVYFPLMYYIYALGAMIYAAGLFVFSGIRSFGGLMETAMLSLGHWLAVSRAISLILGVMSVWLIYFISQRLFNQRLIALISALFFALSPFNVALSHFGKIWTPQVFFLLLAFYFILRFWSDPVRPANLSRIFWTAILIIASLAVNLVGAMAYVIWLLVVWLYYTEGQAKKFFHFIFSRQSILFHLLLLILLAGVIFLAQGSKEVYNAGWQVFMGGSGLSASGFGSIWSMSWWRRVGLTFNFLLQFETVAFVLLVPAFWLMAKKSRKDFWFLLISLVAFFMVLSPPLLAETRTRYLSLLVPFLVLPAGWILGQFCLWLKQRNHWFGWVLFIAILPALFIGLKYDYVLSQNSPKLDLYYWIKDNLQPSENILLVNAYLLQDLAPHENVISLIKEYAPGYYSARLNYLAGVLPGRSDIDSYGLYTNGFICDFPDEIISQIDFNYLAVVNNYFYEFWPSELAFCDNLLVFKLVDDNLIFESNTAPFYYYSIDSGSPLESYQILWHLKKTGRPVRIYKVK